MNGVPLPLRLRVVAREGARGEAARHAAAIAAALRVAGCDAELVGAAGPIGPSLQLFDPAIAQPEPGGRAMLWVVSHAGAAAAAPLDRYDHVFAGSARLADALSGRLGARVSVLPPATDPRRMRPRSDAIEAGLLFVGDERPGGRPALELAVRERFAPEIWGRGWDDRRDLAQLLRGEVVCEDELARRYAGAWAVLHDTAEDERRFGLLPGRALDALGCGAPLILDEVAETPEALLPWIHVWRRPEDFREMVEAALAEGEIRRAARRGFALEVASRHSFAVRAETILSKAREILG